MLYFMTRYVWQLFSHMSYSQIEFEMEFKTSFWLIDILLQFIM